jgi:hypothetical protein
MLLSGFHSQTLMPLNHTHESTASAGLCAGSSATEASDVAASEQIVVCKHCVLIFPLCLSSYQATPEQQQQVGIIYTHLSGRRGQLQRVRKHVGGSSNWLHSVLRRSTVIAIGFRGACCKKKS